MKWNKHSKLEGAHAYLGASQHSWLNYSEDQLIARYHNSMAKLIGTRKHNLAKEPRNRIILFRQLLRNC